MQDSEIIELYFARDEAAIESTAQKYGGYCHRIAYNVLGDIFDSDECVSDTYLRVWNAIPPTRPKIFSSFIGRITRNLAIDRYNARNTEKRGGRVVQSLDELSECIGTESLDRELTEGELAEIISAFLRSEPKLSRCVFIRKYFHLCSVGEIARLYKISESNVKITLHRSRKRLALHLKKEGVYI